MLDHVEATPLSEGLAMLYAALPADRPFSSAEARHLGLTYVDLRRLVQRGLLLHPIRGAYAVPSLPDTLELRVAVLKLVVPSTCVVTDRTAAWLWGVPRILAPNDHLVTPAVSVFCPPGCRLRNTLTASGERSLARKDTADLDGLRVTTPLRTACDLGRLLHRDQALAALDSLARLGDFTVDDLLRATVRFKGYRGVVQFRDLVLLVDLGAESPGESILRLRWLDTGLPRPQTQIEVETPWGTPYRLDMGLRSLRFAAEYDGEEFHGPSEKPHDDGRRAWLREEGGWTIVIARRDNVHGPRQDIHASLQQGYDQALRSIHR